MSHETLDVTELTSEGGAAHYASKTLPFMSKRVSLDCLFLGLGSVVGFLMLFAVGTTYSSLWAKFALVPFLTWFLLLSFSMGHEGMHGNVVRGGKAARFINACLSTLFTGMTLASWHGFSYSHAVHHRFTNDPEKDSNWWVVRWIGWGAIATVLLAPFWENGKNISMAVQNKRWDVLGQIAAYFAAAAAILTVLALNVGWQNVLILWVLPGYLNYGAVVYFVGYAPHHKQARDIQNGDYESHEKIYLRHPVVQGLVTILYFGNNYHSLHHVYPRVPMHRFGPLARDFCAIQDAGGTPAGAAAAAAANDPSPKTETQAA